MHVSLQFSKIICHSPTPTICVLCAVRVARPRYNIFRATDNERIKGSMHVISKKSCHAIPSWQEQFTHTFTPQQKYKTKPNCHGRPHHHLLFTLHPSFTITFIRHRLKKVIPKHHLARSDMWQKHFDFPGGSPVALPLLPLAHPWKAPDLPASASSSLIFLLSVVAISHRRAFLFFISCFFVCSGLQNPDVFVSTFSLNLEIFEFNLSNRSCLSQGVNATPQKIAKVWHCPPLFRSVLQRIFEHYMYLIISSCLTTL